MQDIPDKVTLIAAVGRFLSSELPGAIQDPGLRFRVLIAANILGVVERELRLEQGHYEAEVGRLAELLDGLDKEALLAAHGDADRRAALRPHYQALIEAEGVDEVARFAHLKATLAETLSVVNPRFDLSATIDKENP